MARIVFIDPKQGRGGKANSSVKLTPFNAVRNCAYAGGGHIRMFNQIWRIPSAGGNSDTQTELNAIAVAEEFFQNLKHKDDE